MIAEALVQLTPNAEWTINGDSYEDIVWLSSGITKPSKSEVTAKIAELETAEPMRLLRSVRNQKLRTSDWTQGADVPEVIKTPWATYRQKLRDLPKTANPSLDSDNILDNSSINWPEEPS